MGYDILVMALNKKGKSGPVILQGFTVKNPEKQTGKKTFFWVCAFSNKRSIFVK
jgi:hypothetical protein